MPRRELSGLTEALRALDPDSGLLGSSGRPAWQSRKVRGLHFGRLLAAMQDHDRKDAARLGAPIMGFVGPNGGGKTVCAVKTLIPYLRRGGHVVSNLPLLDGVTGVPWDSFTLLEDYDQLAGVRDCVVFLDEIVTTSGSRTSSALPFQVEYLLQTLRHSNVRLYWTAPSVKRADVVLREVTQFVTECRGFAGDRRVARAALEAGDTVPLWAPKRLFRFTTYDFAEFSEWSVKKKDVAHSFAREWWWGPGSPAFLSYDTLGQVVRVAESNPSGRCLRCGGTRRARVCHCSDEVAFESAQS